MGSTGEVDEFSRAGAMTFERSPGVIAFVMASVLPFGAAVHEQTRAASKPTFEVVSVRINESNERPRFRVNAVPQTGRLTLTGMTVQELIRSAYSVQAFELIGNDSPVFKHRVDVVAKASGPSTVAEMQRMLQPMLERRFTLAVHRETRDMEALLMVRTADRLGPRIKTTTFDCRGLGTTTVFAMAAATPQAPKDQPCGFLPAESPGRIVANGIEMTTLAANLAVSLGRPVLDMTGLAGRYDIDVAYASIPTVRRSPRRWPINWTQARIAPRACISAGDRSSRAVDSRLVPELAIGSSSTECRDPRGDRRSR
jgi:uncharacterized protein (TIGR03435 family)